MNAPVSIEPRSVVIADTTRLVLPIAIGLLLLGGLFNTEVSAALQTWDASTAYNHCFLIIPIVLYLLWDRRSDLAGIPARPMLAALPLGLPLAAAWLVAERLGIMEGRQLAAISFVELLLLTVLGWRLWRAMAGPLLYLYFLVPVGEFLTPTLQDITTFFITNGLLVLGVPAYIDGYVVEIPQGTFFVAEACSGLRFLIASIAFGCLYALIMYRDPMRRGVFILVSIIVPIIANGLRAIGIVYLGYLLGSAQAAAADHIIYGWVFFSAVILLLIALGLPFRQDERPTGPQRPIPQRPIPQRPTQTIPISNRVAFAGTLGLIGLAAISPAVAIGLAATAQPPAVPSSTIDVGQGCVLSPTARTDWTGPARGSQRVTCRETVMQMRWEIFSPRSTAAPLMAERRRMVMQALTEGLAENWLEADDGAPGTWRIMRSTNPAYLTAVAVWIDGKPIRPGLPMRLLMARNSLTGSAYTPIVVTVTPLLDPDAHDMAAFKQAEADLPAFLLTHKALAQTIAAITKLP